MINYQELDALIEVFENRFEEINNRILNYIGSVLKDIGELTPSQAKKLQQMYTYGADMDKISKQLSNVSNISLEEINLLYEKVAKEEQDWSKPFFDANGITQIPLEDNILLQNIIRSAATLTQNTLYNISKTTAVGIKTAEGFKNLDTFYKESVDNAILAVATGVEDYNKVIRQSVKDLGNSGLRLKYDSGYTKRIDSAIRQNILDGVGYVAQNIAIQNGEAFGADGVEISAHSTCAPDHLPYQGRQYSKDEYDKLQDTLTRPIGEWNCRHFGYPIVLGISKPVNSKEEISEMERQSNKLIELDGETYTRYECTQLQRELETKMRYAKEERELYKTVGDVELQRKANEKIRILLNKYVEVSNKASIPTRLERAKLVRGKTKNSFEILGKNSIIKLSIDDENRIMKYDFSEAIKYRGKLNDRTVRKWYKYHDEQIPNLIDKTKTIEEQARQACDLRNKHRTQARDLMRNQETRKQVDLNRPNKTFDELLQYKINEKGMNREAAIIDILATATKTNKEVNTTFGLE